MLKNLGLFHISPKNWEIWEKVKNILKKEFDNEPVYNEKYIKTKIKSYKPKSTPYFHNNKVPKESSERIYLSLILIDSVKKKIKTIVIVKCF